jgi:hypothetical protein
MTILCSEGRCQWNWTATDKNKWRYILKQMTLCLSDLIGYLMQDALILCDYIGYLTRKILVYVTVLVI